MALFGGGGGGHHHGGHGGGGGFHGMYPPWWTQTGYPVAYQFYYGANQCPDTYCPVHDDKCECYCKHRRPIAEKSGGGMFGLSGPHHHHRTASGFRSPWGVPLPDYVWWQMRCPNTTCPKHQDACGCECPFRVSKVGGKTTAWDIDLSGSDAPMPGPSTAPVVVPRSRRFYMVVQAWALVRNMERALRRMKSGRAGSRELLLLGLTRAERMIDTARAASINDAAFVRLGALAREARTALGMPQRSDLPVPRQGLAGFFDITPPRMALGIAVAAVAAAVLVIPRLANAPAPKK